MTVHPADRWGKTTFGRLARIGNGADYSSVEVEEGGYPVYGSGGEFRRASSYLFDGESVLLGRKGTVDRPLYVNGKFWTVDTMFYSVIDRSRLLPRFAYYWATTLPFGAWATDTALPSMTSTAIKAAAIALPSLPEQRAIADYLDRETAQIDAFIAKNEELITLLTERRAAVIARVVLRGLDAAAELRASGVTWLGDVPSHWRVSRLSRWFEVTLGKMLDEAKFAGTVGDVLPYVRASNIKAEGLDLSDVNSMPFTPSEQAKFSLRTGDLVVVEGGSIGVNAPIEEDMDGWGFQKTVNRVRAIRGDLTRFLGYQLDVIREAGVLDMITNVSTIQHLTAEKLERIVVAMPPVEEQEAIVRHIARATSAIDQAISTAAVGVRLARERRAALISAAVTGKIDVGVAA
ncbi:restriction endonuclease subunit S [Microbacterium fluvii]|uniref:Restriction endonuclease subunit S n=1 Tax=Microbacterium fluvii TaxID=415215 RepID=A0ABW2HB34_9MICO|nr:restriction endonuclease subunit S [Microbacterium fluvii]MCU4671272.1 restriction endonuclease subunit S [Microbacterium fluvii]